MPAGCSLKFHRFLLMFFVFFFFLISSYNHVFTTLNNAINMLSENIREGIGSALNLKLVYAEKSWIHTWCFVKVKNFFKYCGLFKSKLKTIFFFMLVHLFLTYITICSHFDCLLYFQHFKKLCMLGNFLFLKKNTDEFLLNSVQNSSTVVKMTIGEFTLSDTKKLWLVQAFRRWQWKHRRWWSPRMP